MKNDHGKRKESLPGRGMNVCKSREVGPTGLLCPRGPDIPYSVWQRLSMRLKS